MIVIQFFQQQIQAVFQFICIIGRWMEMQVLLHIFLLQQGGLEEGNNLLSRYVLVHNFCEHLVVNPKKQNRCRLIQQVVLMKTVFVDQTEITSGKYDVFSQDPLAEFAFCNVGKFNVIVGVKLCLFAGRK